jgi:hypothetical protein
MPTIRPASAGSRGPIARQPARTPTGYRIDDRTRFELQAAALFTGCDPKLQSVLDLAVAEFLDRLKQAEGFRDALRNAEREQQRRAGLRRLPSDSEERPTMD